MRILIVDDENVCRTIMKAILSSIGECDTVASGREAIEAINRGWENLAPYDVIMLDILLEDDNGVNLLVNIREMEEARNLPEGRRARIIMATSQSDKDNVLTSRMARCNGYILKPYTKASVYQCLRKVWTDYADTVFGTTL